MATLTSRRELMTKEAIDDSIDILDTVLSLEETSIRYSMTTILGNLY
jgi:hypothetical protein